LTSEPHKQFLKLSQWQDDFLVCYRPSASSWWGDRTTFKSEDYDKNKPYNHRAILHNEVVVEYDGDEPEENRRLVDIVAHRLSVDNIEWRKLTSGNKSTHLHIMIHVNGAMNLSLLKNAFIRYYTQNERWGRELPLPDMGLTGNRLIRADYGVHEKTGDLKKPIFTTPNYYSKLNRVRGEIWSHYESMYERSMKWKSSMLTKDLSNSKQIKMLMDTVRFNKYGDGRERALYILIHALKPLYVDSEDGKTNLSKFLQEWYRNSKGHKLSSVDVDRKVDYHWPRTYNIGYNYINTFLEEIGATDYVDKVSSEEQQTL